MRKITPNLIRLLVALAIVLSLVAIVAAPASAAANISLSVSAGKVGTPVTITATDFTPDAYMTAQFDGVNVTTIPASVKADSSGNATFAITIPAHVIGTYNITVTDGALTKNAPFTVQPSVAVTSPTSKQGTVGSTITVRGTGFNQGVSAFVLIEEAGSGNLTIGSSIVDNTGTFTVTGAVPPLTSGAHTVWGKDNAGNETYSIPANCDMFTVTPTIAISPSSGLAGSTANLSGSGWAQGNVTVIFAGSSTTTVVAGANGQIAAAYTIPTSAALGINQIVATQQAKTASTTFTVVARALSLTPTSGPKGTSVLVTGSNMSTGPGHYIAAGNLTFGGNTWNTANISIDTSGVIIPVTLTVKPEFLLGANTVQAIDDQGLIATATFTVTKPTIAINPTTGPKGSTVVVTGSGWVPGKVVTISLDSVAAQSVTPDSTGAIAGTITIPIDAAPGPHTITASDGSVGNSADAVTFTVPGAAITVSPTSGAATTTVALSGTGFNAYFPITVSIGGYTLTSQALSDGLGAFTYTFNIPGLQPGAQVILATDGTHTATTFFTITAAPVSIQNQLAGISSVLVRVWGYFGGQWQLYDPADPAGSDLATLTPGRGYWINVSQSTTLVYGAYSYALSSGWNLVGWR
jgi:hypothetical protein